MYYPCSESKLICVFVFAYAKIRFSHDAAHFYVLQYKSVVLCLGYLGAILFAYRDFIEKLNKNEKKKKKTLTDVPEIKVVSLNNNDEKVQTYVTYGLRT